MMKLTVSIARYLTGLLFVFSGLVKAIDPRGLAYKMQEFFESWSNAGFMKGMMEQLGEQALSFSILMITLEVAVGLALLLGWQKKFISWILFALILFFSFLTSYVLFSGKIRACGCFGDCIPLTPIQTFTKDIILLLFAVLLLFNQKYILPAAKPLMLLLIMLFATGATLALQFYVMKHLPLIDCLPYKKGNNLLELRKMPANAIPDEYAIQFIYKKNGATKEFSAASLPDSSWEFVDRQQKLVKAGINNSPLINDFSLSTTAGNDTTESILSQAGIYYILFIKEVANLPSNFKEDQLLALAAKEKGIPFYIVTARRDMISNRYNELFLKGSKLDIPIFTCDATAIKTAARADMVLYKMEGAEVKIKWGWVDFDKLRF
jgi:uncharacterized membrane protein YphA (DoxX/SURF4 family)